MNFFWHIWTPVAQRWIWTPVVYWTTLSTFVPQFWAPWSTFPNLFQKAFFKGYFWGYPQYFLNDFECHCEQIWAPLNTLEHLISILSYLLLFWATFSMLSTLTKKTFEYVFLIFLRRLLKGAYTQWEIG